MTPSRIHRLTLTHFRNYRAASRADARRRRGAGRDRTAPARPIASRRSRFCRRDAACAARRWRMSPTIRATAPGRCPPRSRARSGLPRSAPASMRRATKTAATSRRCRIDREPVSSATAFGDHLRMVWLTPAMDGLFSGRGLGAAALLRPAGAGDRQRAFQPRVGAGALAALAQPAARGAQLRRPLVRRDRARNRRACGRGRRHPRPDRDQARGDAARARRGIPPFRRRRSCSTAGWKMRWSTSPPPRWRIVTARSCAPAARATPPPAARWTARISPICR